MLSALAVVGGGVQSYDIEDLIDVDTLSRPTEAAAFEREQQARRLAWRVERWGEVLLTEREHEAMTLEMDAMHERTQAYKDAEQDANRYYKDMQQKDHDTNYGLYVVRSSMTYYWTARELYYAQLLLKIERGIQSQIARRMGVSPGRVSQLLSSASAVMEVLQETQPYAGWRVEQKGRHKHYTLVARVAVTAKSGQVLQGSFEPQPMVKAA